MFGSKVFLTYKRKRQSLSSSFDHGNWCHNSFYEDPHNSSLSAQDKHGKITAEKTSEKHKERPMDASDGRRLCFGCVKQPDCSSSLPVQKPVGLKAGDHENYDATEMIATTHSFSTKSPHEDTSVGDAGELPLVEKASQNGCDSQRNSYPSESSGNECDNSDNKIISPSIELDAGNGFNLICSETSTMRKLSSACGDGSPISNKSMEEFTVSLSKADLRNLSGHMVMQTNLISPLITFNRCYKRKKSLAGTDKQSKLHEEENISLLTKWSMLANGNACSCNESSCKGCSVDNVTDLNQSVELSEGGKPMNQAQDETSCKSCSMIILTDLNQSAELSDQTREKVKNADSPCIRDVVSGTREKLHQGEGIAKTVSPRAGQEVPSQSSLIDKEAQHIPRDCHRVSFNVDFKDRCPAATTANEELENSQPSVRDATQNFLCNGVKKIGGYQPQFDLPVNSAKEHTVDLDLGADKHPIHLRMRTHRDLDSASKSSAIAKAQASELELLKPKKDKVGTLHSTHHSQLISEEKAIGGVCSSIVQPQSAACMMSDERMNLQQIKTNQPVPMPSISLSLGLPLPMELKIGSCDSINCSVMPSANSTTETREIVQDGFCLSSTNQRPSLLRHKIVLDNIVSRARALNERGSFQEKLKPHTIMWSEEELDFLWIGVRRHGRGNWDAILRDPRLRFSPLRLPGDLAERWEAEQLKLLNDISVPQFKYPKAERACLEGNSCFLDPKGGFLRENTTDETKLSLGDVYAYRESKTLKKCLARLNFQSNVSVHSHRPTSHSRRASHDNNIDKFERGFFSSPGSLSMPRENSYSNEPPSNCLEAKNHLPHWLREAVITPPKSLEPNLSAAVSLSSYPEMLGAAERCFNANKTCCLPQDRLSGLRTSDLHMSNGSHYSTYSRRKYGMVKMNKSLEHRVNKPDELIIIDSDASSEETISDDHRASL